MADRDMVNHPSHYETGKFECIDVMLETQGYLATLGFCIGNVFKYSYRHGGKNGKEDIEKLGWYRDKYIELLNRREEFLNNSEDIVKDLAKFFPDADEMMDDFSKYMNPPVEDEPQVNPDKDGWYDAEHIYMLEGANPKTREINVPADKCLETVIDNGVSLLWHRGDNILAGCLCENTCGDGYKWYMRLNINTTVYYVAKARIIDIPESCEGGNE